MKEAVSIASDTTIRQLRAYINVDHANIKNVANPLPSEKLRDYKPTGAEISNPKIGPEIVIQVRNSGQTPAYNVKMWGIIFINNYPPTFERPKEPNPSEQGTKTTISSQGPPYFTVRMDNPLTEDQKKALRSGKIAIYIYGEITYTDIFEKIHKTTFLGRHGPETTPIGISILIAMCDKGNEAD